MPEGKPSGGSLLLLVVVVAAVVSVGGIMGLLRTRSHPDRPPDPKPVPPPAFATMGLPAPDAEVMDVEGGHFKLSDYQGNVVLLNFWRHD
jgi:hypothetical protein